MSEREFPFFAELKRRTWRVPPRFYAASVWLLVQVATQVFLEEAR